MLYETYEYESVMRCENPVQKGENCGKGKIGSIVPISVDHASCVAKPRWVLWYTMVILACSSPCGLSFGYSWVTGEPEDLDWLSHEGQNITTNGNPSGKSSGAVPHCSFGNCSVLRVQGVLYLEWLWVFCFDLYRSYWRCDLTNASGNTSSPVSIRKYSCYSIF